MNIPVTNEQLFEVLQLSRSLHEKGFRISVDFHRLHFTLWHYDVVMEINNVNHVKCFEVKYDGSKVFEYDYYINDVLDYLRSL